MITLEIRIRTKAELEKLILSYKMYHPNKKERFYKHHKFQFYVIYFEFSSVYVSSFFY